MPFHDTSSGNPAGRPPGAAAPAAAPPVPYAHPFLRYSLLTLMMLLWSANYIVAKVGYREVDGLTMGVLRVVIAAVGLVPIHLFHRGRHALHRPFAWRDYRVFLWMGLCLAANQSLFIYGLSRTTAEHSALIIAIGPVNILWFAVAVGLERMTINKLAGILLAFAGVTLLAAGRGFGSHNPAMAGDLLTLGGSLAFSFYAVIGKRVAGRYDAMTLNSWTNFFAALLLAPLALHRIVLLDWSRVTWIGWGALFYIGLGPSLAGYLIWIWALRHMAASRMGVIVYVQPVAGALIGVFFLHEGFSSHLLLSGVMVLAGVALTEWHPRGTEAEDESVAEVAM